MGSSGEWLFPGNAGSPELPTFCGVLRPCCRYCRLAATAVPATRRCLALWRPRWPLLHAAWPGCCASWRQEPRGRFQVLASGPHPCCRTSRRPSRCSCTHRGHAVGRACCGQAVDGAQDQSRNGEGAAAGTGPRPWQRPGMDQRPKGFHTSRAARGGPQGRLAWAVPGKPAFLVRQLACNEQDSGGLRVRLACAIRGRPAFLV